MRWKMKPFSAKRAVALGKELGLYSMVAGVLVARGFEDPQTVREFINPSLDKDWSDPKAIADLDKIAARLEDAVRKQKTICIFGDYDVDGITASAIMSNILRALGSQPHTVHVVLPLRQGEGYGLSRGALERILALHPEVVLTVDCGVSAADEVALLLEQGIEVLITDHHEASGALPKKVLVADPKLTPQSPAGILAGAGVALKLAALLCMRFDKPLLWKSQLDLAALGTIADCMPLVGENRALVAAGIKILNTQPRPGIAAVHDVSGGTDTPVSAQGLSFGLIPRLNAAGRVSDPLIAYDLLTAQEPERASQLACKLEQLNSERKELEAVLYRQAVEQVGHDAGERRSIVVGGDCWHDGVKGIVASRLVRDYGAPSIVFSYEEGLAVGSGRTVGAVDLHAAVGKLRDMLLRFGGHRAAIGLTIEQSRVDEFAARLEEVMLSIPKDALIVADEIDCLIGLEQLSLEAVDECKILEPFGNGNPEPRFLTTDVLLKAAKFVGADKRHLSFVASDGVRELQAIWFNAPYQELESLPSQADLIYRVQIDEWRGRRKIKLFILDILSEDRENTAELISAGCGAQEKLENLLFLGSQEALNQQLASILCNTTVTLRTAQLKCLETLEQNKNTLAIMATGRGKSIIFHIHAAKLALQQDSPSLFIYPLRSLISDQEHLLAQTLGHLGLACASLTGSTPKAERERIARGIKEGTINLVLSTPEFVIANEHTFDFWQRFRFVVIDEAHHIATSNESFRPDYTQLERLRALVPEEVFLGASATSDKATTDSITQSLGIEQIIVDTSRRPNLTLVDKRNTQSKHADLVAIVAGSTKSLIYASSRVTTIELCKQLRKELREQAPKIAFYNAALTPEDRLNVEQAFRNGEINCLIATSAFGEGVNIPDIRDVVLYDVPYSMIDFNQIAGRAGRDGLESRIQVLAQASDVVWMAERLAQEEGESEGAEGSRGHRSAQSVGSAECFSAEGSEDAESDRTALDELSRARQHFETFADWLFKTSPHGLSSVIQRPLTPLEEE